MHFDLQSDTQVWRGIYEQSLQVWLREVVRPDSVCLDIGAAEGWCTLMMATLATEGSVHAFEPSERGDWVEKNLALNDEVELGSVHFVRACVGDESSDGQPGFVSLDGYLAAESLERVDVVKIDVDGLELEVLDGAEQLLLKYRPEVCVEVHSHELLEAVLARLSSWSYLTKVVDPPPHEHRPIGFNPTVFASPE